MTTILRKVSVILTLVVIVSSCVSQKKYADLVKDKDRLDVNVERSHKEIRELKEVKLTLEDQIKAKNVEITKSEKQANTFKRQNEEIGSKLVVLDEQMKKMMTDLEITNYQSASLIVSYEQKITELKIANAVMSSRSASRGKTITSRKSKTRKFKVALPAVLKT